MNHPLHAGAMPYSGFGYAYPLHALAAQPLGYGYSALGYGGFGSYGGIGPFVSPYGGSYGYSMSMPSMNPYAYGYDGGGYAQPPRNTYLRDKISKVRAENPDVDLKALQEVGRVYRANPNIGKNPAAMQNFRERLEKKFGAEESEKALAAMGISDSHSHTNTGRPSFSSHASHHGASTDGHKPGRKPSRKPPQDTQQQEPASSGSSILGWLGVAAGGLLGWKLMNNYGGGISATGLIVTAVVAVLGGMVGNVGNTMIAGMMGVKKPDGPANAKQQTAALPLKIDGPQHESGAGLKEAAEKYRQASAAPAAPEAQGMDVEMPTGPSGVPAVVKRPAPHRSTQPSK